MVDFAAKLAGVLVGSVASVLVVGAALGWLVAVLWNALPFLASAHHMGVLDGMQLLFLTGLLFKSTK